MNSYFKLKIKKFKIICIIYTNYNNNFLIGIIGSRKLVVKIKKKVNNFIKINLCLYIKNNIIFVKNLKPIFFLDFYLKYKVKQKEVLLKKKMIFNLKKKFTNKILFLNIKFINNFKIILTKIIYEYFTNIINPIKIYNKQKIKLLNFKLLSFIKLNVMLKNLNIKQKIYKKESISLN